MPVDFFHKEFRQTRSGFPDLLRYASVIKPGVVLGKGGELMATFQYRGPDMQCSSEPELNFLRISACKMVNKLGKGWMMHTTTLRKESFDYDHAGAFPDPVTLAIEREREAQHKQEGTHYENEFFITFTYLADVMLVSKIREFAFETSDKGQMTPQRIAQKALAYFERHIMELVGSLESALKTRMTRCTARKVVDPTTLRPVWFDDQLAHFKECLTGQPAPVRLPSKTAATGVDFLLGSMGFITGIRPVLNGKNIRVVAIESLPDKETQFGVLEVLNVLGVKFRWTTRWIARDAEAAKASTRIVRSKWRQKIRGIVADALGRTTGPVNADAQAMSMDAEAVLNDWEEGSVVYGHWSSTVILTDTNAELLDASVTYLIREIQAKGFVARDEDVNCVEAFLGSLPGHGYENLRRPEIHSMNLADCLPLTSTWQGPLSNPCSFYKKHYGNKVVPPLLQGSASGGTPFRVVLHNGDVGHTLMLGPTGAGKSTALGLIAAQHFRYPGAQFFGIEKGQSMMALCLGAGGTHYNFMVDESEGKKGFPQFACAPLDQIDRIGDRAWAVDWVETIVTLHGEKVDVDMRSDIRRAMDLLATRPVGMRSITNFVQVVQNRSVKKVMSEYEANFAGGMLNGTRDTITTSRFTVFEMEKLMELNDHHVVPVLLYLFRMVERKLDGSPTIVCLDEAWLMLKHPMFEDKLKEWFKVLRKANALVIFATQELQDVANSPIASTIFSACQTKILLPNAAAQMDDNARLYRQIGLTPREIELLMLATPKRDYLFISPAGRRLFQLELGPVALAFVAASGIDDRKAVQELRHQHGEQWLAHWMKRQGLSPNVLGIRSELAMAA